MPEQSMFKASELKSLVKGKRRNKKDEENLQLKVCKYLKLKYPKVDFACDLASGMKLPIHVASRNAKMRSSRAQNDLDIDEPRKVNGIHYCGLKIELKKAGVKIYTKKGELVSDKHIREQFAYLERMSCKGYKAVFACGFEEAKKIIDEYLQG